MQIVGVSVTGLDVAFNGATIHFMYVDPSNTHIRLESVKVADSYENEGETVGYQSGCAYKKLDKPFLFDLDKLNREAYDEYLELDQEEKEKFGTFVTSSKMECYIDIGNDEKIQVLNNAEIENAKITVPTSPAGTKDADLAKKWLVVDVKNGLGTFSFTDNAVEPINATLTCITMDVSVYEEPTAAVQFNFQKKQMINNIQNIH